MKYKCNGTEGIEISEKNVNIKELIITNGLQKSYNLGKKSSKYCTRIGNKISEQSDYH